MKEAIYFKSSMFDVSKEDKDCINGFYGQSLLLWLKESLAATLNIDEPDTEDWGWYSYLVWEKRKYLIGAMAYLEEGDDPNSELQWAFQVDKILTIKEKLLGYEKMSINDPCFQFFIALFENEPQIHSVKIG